MKPEINGEAPASGEAQEIGLPTPDPAPKVRAIKGLLAATILGLLSWGFAHYGEQYAGSVATVDGHKISKAEFQRLYTQVHHRYQQQFQVDFESASGHQIESDLKQSVLNELIQREIVGMEANSRGISVPDEAVENEIERIKKGFPSADDFHKLLKDQGADVDGLRRQIRAGMLEARLQDHLAGGSVIGEQEAQKYYSAHAAMYQQAEQVQARHILVKDKNLALSLRRQLTAGADFSKLAAQHSEDPGSKSSGGDLGFFSRGKMVKEFEAAAFSLSVGSISQPVKSDFGYHLIKVESRKPSRTVPFGEVKNEITANLIRESRKAAFAAWLEQRRQRAVITYGRGYESGASDPGHANHAHEGH
jgi:parvulin-like peptidyl-prolyl isomerase